MSTQQTQRISLGDEFARDRPYICSVPVALHDGTVTIDFWLLPTVSHLYSLSTARMPESLSTSSTMSQLGRSARIIRFALCIVKRMQDLTGSTLSLFHTAFPCRQYPRSSPLADSQQSLSQKVSMTQLQQVPAFKTQPSHNPAEFLASLSPPRLPQECHVMPIDRLLHQKKLLPKSNLFPRVPSPM